MTVTPPARDFGLGRGKVFPAEQARSLLNPLRRLVQSPRRTVAAMGLSSDARVLEVGSGPGFFSPLLADAVPDGRLVLVDLQAEMLVTARARLARFATVSYAQGDACALPIGSGRFDAVLLDAQRQGPTFWFQQLDSPRTGRNRFHVDIYLPHDRVQARIDAALAAGGRIVSDAHAPGWWTLADPEGNEVDLAIWG